MNYRNYLEQQKGKYSQVVHQLQSHTEKLSALKIRNEQLEKASCVIIYVAQETQNSLRYHLSELVSLAMSSVFEDPYEFDMEFIQRRSQSECDLFFLREGERVTPLTASGGGTVDVAAFALRVSLWSLQKPHTRPILILDEPFKNVSFDYQKKVSSMVHAISERLGIQIVMVSHSEELARSADRVFKISQKKGVSYGEVYQIQKEI